MYVYFDTAVIQLGVNRKGNFRADIGAKCVLKKKREQIIITIKKKSKTNKLNMQTYYYM